MVVKCTFEQKEERLHEITLKYLKVHKQPHKTHTHKNYKISIESLAWGESSYISDVEKCGKLFFTLFSGNGFGRVLWCI